MKTSFTFLFMMIVFCGFVSAQEKKPKSKKPSLAKDSVYSYRLVPRSSSGDSLMLTMPVDTSRGTSVPIPNAYRKGIVEPVPMPTHRVKMISPKKVPDSSARRYVPPVPMPNQNVEPVRPKKKEGVVVY